MTFTADRATLKKMVHFAQTGQGDPKIVSFMKRVKPQLRNNILFYQNKPFIPRESVGTVLQKVGLRGMPLDTHEKAAAWINQRFVGITKNDVIAFINAYRTVQRGLKKTN